MNLSFRAVDRTNFLEIAHLRVSPEQENFVAPNDVSIMEAYVTVTGGDVALPYGIYDGDTLVGFFMLGYETEWFADAPTAAKGSYCLWRLMIDARYQRKGYGSAAMPEILKLARSFPAGRAERIWVSYEPGNDVARRLYARFGFEENGEVSDGETVAVLRL